MFAYIHMYTYDAYIHQEEGAVVKALEQDYWVQITDPAFTGLDKLLNLSAP